MSSNDVAARTPSGDARERRAPGSDLGRDTARRMSRTVALVAWDALVPTMLLIAGDWMTGAPARLGPRSASIPALALLLGLIAPVALACVGAYRQDARPSLSLLRRLVIAAAACALVVVYAAGHLGWPLGADAAALGFAALPIAWLGVRAALPGARAAQKVLLIGSGRVARQVAALTERHPDARLEVVGCLDDEPLGGPGALTCLGGVADLDWVLDGRGIDRVIVTFTRHTDERLMSIIRRCDARGVEVDVVPRLFDLMPVRARSYEVGEMALVNLGGSSRGASEQVAKRVFDVVCSSLLLILFAPVMAACALAVLIDGGRPALFRQDRIGRGGTPFEILKFRTMTREADAVGLARIASLKDGGMEIADAVAALKPKDDPRITRVGGFLRKTSLDELPQLWNVVRGDMSLVGPRPLRAFECDALSEWELRRQGVRPGITGLWQVTSRSDGDWAERMRLDYRYVRHWSLASDVRILARTVTTVLARKGAV